MDRTPAGRLRRRLGLVGCLAAIALSIAASGLVWGEGSGTIYRTANATRFRSHLEWRTGTYGGGDSSAFVLLRRTLLRVYAQQGERISLGSSAVAVGGDPQSDLGDIRVFNPGQVSGPIGQEAIPALAGAPPEAQAGAFANGFSCLAQRAATGEARGRIASRTQELAGPLPNPNGYAPCVYVAPVTGIYAVTFSGPAGDNSNLEPRGISGQINSTPDDFGPLQATSVTAWDVTVRSQRGEERPGRLFAYYYTGNTGGGGRPISGQVFVVTATGFRYRVTFDGDPFGFIFYANEFGFRNGDGTPLYRNLLADASAATQTQNELRELQGNVGLLPPQYPLFVSLPDPLVLDALGIPRVPVAPALSQLVFSGPGGGSSTGVNQGGTFSFVTTLPGVYYIVVSRDGQNFDPEAPDNRLLRSVASAVGVVTVPWDGRDNTGEPFPPGDFSATAAMQGGEVHFPFLDVENNLAGGPIIQLDNPPDITEDGVPDCPPWNGGCFGAFYDDRGYRDTAGTLIGTAVNGPLCPGDAQNPRGFGNPPLLAASDPARGFDTRTEQRAFGFNRPANPASICLPTGGFGDKKGLDLWTFYPSNVLRVPLRIVDLTAVTISSLTAVRSSDSIVVRWETGLELNSLGFHVLRSTTGRREDAVRVTETFIPARGGGSVYSWLDPAAADPDTPYTYWLEEIETRGAANIYGPVRPVATPTQLPYRIALPMLRS